MQRDGGRAQWRRLGARSWAWLHPDPDCRRWGYANAGLVTDGGSPARALLFDTQFTVGMTRDMLDQLAASLPGVRVDTVVVSHANGDHAWGTHLLAPPAGLVASAATAAELADEVTPTQLADLLATVPAGTPLGDWAVRHFGGFDFTGGSVAAPTVTFRGTYEVAVGPGRVRLVEVGPAHTGGDVIAWVPDEGVVFAGDVVFVGAHPAVWAGSILGWARACQTILDTGAATIVGGHGPLTDPAGVTALRDYLHHIAEHAADRHQAGVPYWRAATGMPLPGYAAGWAHPERLVALIAVAYAELDGVAPPSQAELLTRMAEAAASPPG